MIATHGPERGFESLRTAPTATTSFAWAQHEGTSEEETGEEVAAPSPDATPSEPP